MVRQLAYLFGPGIHAKCAGSKSKDRQGQKSRDFQRLVIADSPEKETPKPDEHKRRNLALVSFGPTWRR